MSKSFDPIITSTAKVLILGSMPSELSLQKQQYYGNPRNQFWRIISEVYNFKFDDNYQRRVQLLHKYQIGVWDVLESCRRLGSLDANITNAKINDFEPFLKKYSNIRLIGCNGKMAHKLFVRNVKTNIPVIDLPSSSPAYTKPLKWKIQCWKALIG